MPRQGDQATTQTSVQQCIASECSKLPLNSVIMQDDSHGRIVRESGVSQSVGTTASWHLVQQPFQWLFHTNQLPYVPCVLYRPRILPLFLKMISMTSATQRYHAICLPKSVAISPAFPKRSPLASLAFLHRCSGLPVTSLFPSCSSSDSSKRVTHL